MDSAGLSAREEGLATGSGDAIAGAAVGGFAAVGVVAAADEVGSAGGLAAEGEEELEQALQQPVRMSSADAA